MYDETIIIPLLAARIGYGSDLELPVRVDTSLQEGTSGRTLPWFHRLATLPNLYATIETRLLPELIFEEQLQQMREEAARSTLTAIMEQSIEYKEEIDYTKVIEDKIELFDEVVGYSLAISVIELMISSNRKNDLERNVNLTYSKLKIELEGVRNDNGHVMSQGLNRKMYFAIRRAVQIIFPTPIIVTSERVW